MGTGWTRGAGDAASSSAPALPASFASATNAWVAELLEQKVPFPIARRWAQERFEKSYVAGVLEAHGGNVSKASMASGIARRYFQVVKARSGPR